MSDKSIKLNLFSKERVKYFLNPTLNVDGHNTHYYRYKAPEILKLGPNDIVEFTRESDIFLLGLILFEAYNQVHPFEGSSNIVTISNILNNPPAEFNCKIEKDK